MSTFLVRAIDVINNSGKQGNLRCNAKKTTIEEALDKFDSTDDAAPTGRSVSEDGQEWAERGTINGTPVILYYYFDDDEIWDENWGHFINEQYFPFDADHVTKITDMTGHVLTSNGYYYENIRKREPKRDYNYFKED